MADAGRILITGADGFVGARLARDLAADGADVLGIVRRHTARAPAGVRICAIGDIGVFCAWGDLLVGVEVVVHLAARAHIVRDGATDPLAEYRRINVAPTAALFRACRAVGVRRFVFASSIGVNGARSIGAAFRETDHANPTEPYAIAKWETEQFLHAAAKEGATEFVIVRPALIYGPGVKGNFHRLMRLVAGGWPIPLGGVTATRNLLGLTAFCELLRLCVDHPKAAGETLLAADAVAVDLPTLLRTMAGAMGRRPRLLSVPTRVLEILGHLGGRTADVTRLLWSLQVDSAKARTLLNWVPTVGFTEEVDAMVRFFMSGSCA